MTRLIPVLLLGFFCYFVYVQALECGIAEQLGEAELQNAIGKCVQVGSNDADQKTEKASPSDTSEETGHQISGANPVVASRIRRNVLNVNLNKHGRYERRRPRITKRDVANSTSEGDHEGEDKNNDNKTGETGMSSKCFLQCVFNELGMVDTNGYPEHHRVSEGLLKNTKGRELRDFVQDSTDECFQLMDQGDKMDTCNYATHLVTCLAEKGRSNCADWQIMSLPFHN